MGRAEGEREGGNEFLRKPLESVRDNYIFEAGVRHQTQRRWRKDDRAGRGTGKATEEQERLEIRGERGGEGAGRSAMRARLIQAFY